MTLQTYSTLDDAIALAEFAHRNQRDKSGASYIKHPMRVLAAVQEQGAPPYVQIGAVLHDVTEDTTFTPEMLLDMGVLPAAVEIIRLVDRHVSRLVYEEKREQHSIACTPDEFYYLQIRKNPGALQVKLADIGDNLLPWRLTYLPEATQDRLRYKYTKAIELLTR